MRFSDDSNYETPWIAGIDEAGRGALAGPVVVACVKWMPKQAVEQPWFVELNDSKKVSAKKRLQLAFAIKRFAWFRIAFVSHIVIDHINVLRASLHGFELVAPDPDDQTSIIIDGNQKPTSMPQSSTLTKGDQRVSAIAAASILAKVARDAYMTNLSLSFPNYQFHQHKGYGTAVHLAALSSHGPCRYHRKTFAPVSQNSTPAPGQEQLLFKQLNLAVTQHDLIKLWNQFSDTYTSYSQETVRRFLLDFQARGMPVLATPQSLRPQFSLTDHKVESRA